jgi:murein DD-endopeptidase MepM/ murein hydrolase activator NlpD
MKGITTVWGNNRRESVTHAGMNRFCFDFMGSDEAGNQMHPGTSFPGRNEDYYGFGRDILSVCDGVVESVEDGKSDIMPRATPVLGDGNIVLVVDSIGRHYNYAHLRKGSATVKPGDRVVAGQKLGEMGNSGYTATPHLHFGVYSPDWKVSLPVRFAAYEIRQEDGTWKRLDGAVPQTGQVVRN